MYAIAGKLDHVSSSCCFFLLVRQFFDQKFELLERWKKISSQVLLRDRTLREPKTKQLLMKQMSRESKKKIIDQLD